MISFRRMLMDTASAIPIGSSAAASCQIPLGRKQTGKPTNR